MEARGNCGGPILDTLPGVARCGPALPHLGPEFDPVRGAPYIRDSDVIRVLSTTDTTDAGRWRVCPVSEMRAAHDLVTVYRRWREGLPLGVATPSASLVEAMLTIRQAEYETDAARYAEGRADG